MTEITVGFANVVPFPIPTTDIGRLEPCETRHGASSVGSRHFDPAYGRPMSFPAAPADLRYRKLLGEAGWRLLPPEVQRRFSKHLAPGETTIYRGEVVTTEHSRCGWLLAQLARLIGGPLPYTAGATGPAVVIVTEEPALHGQIWSRQYPRPGRFPQVIHSAKRFTGPTGLEEYLGLGLVMRLSLQVEPQTLVFRSCGYAIEIGRLTLALPPWLCPGACEIRHRAETDGRFSFELTLAHPLLGRLIHQVAFFQDDVN